MKGLIKKNAKVYLVPDTIETHTIKTYSIANEEFMRSYFPKCVYGLSSNKDMKSKKRKR